LNERPDPAVHGLYDENFEHDACGVGFIADLNGHRTHDIVSKGIEILVNLEHRGASGAEKNTGDGAGILTQLPHAFFLKVGPKAGIKLPPPGQYGVGQVFLPKDPAFESLRRDDRFLAILKRMKYPAT